ncbi:MAG: hypothetical protein F6K40_10030 [Okeania sp. SIO3I5]|uniref:hypothetical protein n=1 Tax=Okeania sp. SIO3I5 TaxID=2607805 RepID=UPI0013B7430E|nr:hypothetical protein [Okeania sp. SIO3I5]NEQ36594.1 hypothetical protein [Okeania sp. SIO3I5]
MDIVETNIRREVKNNGSFNSAFVNTVIKNEVEKWSKSNHFSCTPIFLGIKLSFFGVFLTMSC